MLWDTQHVLFEKDYVTIVQGILTLFREDCHIIATSENLNYGTWAAVSYCKSFGSRCVT